LPLCLSGGRQDKYRSAFARQTAAAGGLSTFSEVAPHLNSSNLLRLRMTRMIAIDNS
jgi:hypothetical protein